MISYHAANGEQRVTLSDDVLEHFAKNRQQKLTAPEAGGQLFATVQGGIINVVKATGPRRTDKRSRFSFIADGWAHQREIKALHKQGLHFVGDWHTHPEMHPSPSPLDHDSMLEMFRESKHDLASFLMVIVGQAQFPDALFVAAVNNDGTHRLPLVDPTMRSHFVECHRDLTL